MRFFELPRRKLYLLLFICALAITGWGLYFIPPGVRIRGDEFREARSAQLPGTGRLLKGEDAQEITPPFLLVPDPASLGEGVLELPDGSLGRTDAAPAADWVFDIASDEVVYIWVRVKWSDSCGNSILLRIDDMPPAVVGQDSIYARWHWVPVRSPFGLKAGRHTLKMIGREDGVRIDSIMFAHDAGYVPGIEARLPGGNMDLRRFADSFERSPGHGQGEWEFPDGGWEITFSLDPNRIPFQYALAGQSEDDMLRTAWLRGHPWRGLRLAFSVCFPEVAPGFAVLLRRGTECERVFLTDAPVPGSDEDFVHIMPVSGGILENQWYRVVLERWGGTFRACIDGRPVLEEYGLPFDAAGTPGFAVSGGRAVVDDVEVTEIPWYGNDGGDLRLPWKPHQDARWFLPRNAGGTWALKGWCGSLTCSFEPLTVDQVTVEAGLPQLKNLSLPGFSGRAVGKDITLLEPSGVAPGTLQLVASGRVVLKRIAVRLTADTSQECFRIGPYHFEDATIADPSDYVDFTPQEIAAMATSPDADLLVRKPKHMQVIGKSGTYAVWGLERGRWRVNEGRLTGRGEGAKIRFWQEFEGDFEMHFRCRLGKAGSALGVVVGEMNDHGTDIGLGENSLNPSGFSHIALPCASDGEWHDVTIRLAGDTVVAAVDRGNPVKHSSPRGAGGGVLFSVIRGTVDIDDLFFAVPRLTSGQAFYAFDRRECDWLREGGKWIDHGGIACALASNWVSLEALDGEGMLWNKRDLKGDLLVSLNLEENTEWFGWKHEPSHIHYPMDNVRIVLSSDFSLDGGYRIEVNCREEGVGARLFRLGHEVRGVPFGDEFPTRYVGGHAPYRPRRSRIKLVLLKGTIRLFVNAHPVIDFEDTQSIPISRVGIGGFHTRVNFSRILVRY